MTTGWGRKGWWAVADIVILIYALVNIQPSADGMAVTGRLVASGVVRCALSSGRCG